MVCYHKQEEWSNKVFHDSSQPAIKLFARNLICAYKSAETWQFESETKKLVTFRTVWLQGVVENVTDINCFMLKDLTGSVKIISCDCVPGDKNWIKEGAYCSVVGTLMKPGSVPEVATLKLADLGSNAAHQALWSLEVRELQLLLAHDVRLQV